MKKIRSILSIVISLLFVSCGALTSLFVEGQEVSSVTVVESENNQEDNFFLMELFILIPLISLSTQLFRIQDY